MTVDKAFTIRYVMQHNWITPLKVELFLNFIGREVLRKSIGENMNREIYPSLFMDFKSGDGFTF
jgi:hypothetical protein